MRPPVRTDERGEPAIDALDAHARNVLFAVLANDRRPIAVVGSGLSLVYGGVSWEESVKRAIAYTIGRIDEIVKMSGKPAFEGGEEAAVYLARQRAALEAFNARGSIDKSSEKYVALDMCSQALDRIDALPRGVAEKLKRCPFTARRGDTPTFRAFMAQVYKDDTFYIRQLLIDRFGLADTAGKEEEKARDNILEMDAEQIQRLADAIYSEGAIGELIGMVADEPLRTNLPNLLAAVLKDLNVQPTPISSSTLHPLPVDRRSLLCLFVGHVEAKKRTAWLRSRIDSVADADEKIRPRAPARPILDPIGKLQFALRVKRYVTLNFDYTLEQRIILDDAHVTLPRPYGLERAVADGLLASDGETGGLTRRFADGLVASTDIYDAKALGRVFEFALDSSDLRAQILHLHGRADNPMSMLLTDSDSNRQYRRDRATRTALEQALDVIQTGNPIVFVGIGLSEAEITRALRDLVSRGDPTAFSPVFAIIGAEQMGTAAWRTQLALFQQYGIHLIHAGLGDDEWVGLARFLAAVDTMKTFIEHIDAVEKGKPSEGSAHPLDADARRRINSLRWRDAPDRSQRDQFRLPDGLKGDRVAIGYLYRQLRALALPRAAVAPPSDAVRKRWIDYLDKFKAKLRTLAMVKALDDIAWGWRDHVFQRRLPICQDRTGALTFEPLLSDKDAEASGMFVYDVREKRSHDRAKMPRYDANAANVQWRHKPDYPDGDPGPEVDHVDDIVAAILAQTSLVVTCYAPLGSGKGSLLRKLVAAYESDRRHVAVVNCNFGIEFDSVLTQVLTFFHSAAALFTNFDDVWNAFEAVNGDPIHNRVEALERLARRLEPVSASPPIVVLSGIERLIDRHGKPVAPELDLLLTALLTADATARTRERKPFQLIVIGATDCRVYIDGKKALVERTRWRLQRLAADELARKEENARLNTGSAPGRLFVKRWPLRWFSADSRARAEAVRRSRGRGPPGRLPPPDPQPDWITNVVWPSARCEPLKVGFLGHLLSHARKRAGSRDEILIELDYAAQRSPEATVPNSARSRAIAAVMRVVLDHWHELAFDALQDAAEDAANRLRAQLDQHVLGTLAFIGMPIESGALDHQHTPDGLLEQIARRLGKTVSQGLIREEGAATIDRLRAFGFLIKIRAHPDDPNKDAEKAYRVVLHRSAMAEMRERIGVRSGDELLSNSFSITLALSMPTDLVVPEEPITRHLKTLVGRLRGAWRDPLLSSNDAVRSNIEKVIHDLRDAIRNQIQDSPFHEKGGGPLSKYDADALKAEGWLRNLDRALRMATTDMQVNTRAAAGIIRSFFSAASLVAQMPSRSERGDRELGEFEEHKRRIERVLNRFRDGQRSIASAERYLGNVKERYPRLVSHPTTKAIAGLIEQCRGRGEIPGLYGADLVWLLNEYGVIALLQGDLHNAERSFRESAAANRVFRTRGSGQVSRRLEINRSLLRIERGRIGEARARLEKIEEELESSQVKSDEERKLIAPLVANYLGLCDHLSGSYKRAADHFDRAIEGLVETDQQRALAVTYIRRASLRLGLNETAAALEDIDRGVGIAEAGRQMDILWRARLTRVTALKTSGSHEEVMTIFRESRRYAKVMQLPRTEVQALRSEAEFYLDRIDDYEYASVLAAEAMTVATRHGMVLQRIALRVLMGRILLRRNDMSGRYLLTRAISHADRIGYQLQVDRAQEAFLKASQRQPD